MPISGAHDGFLVVLSIFIAAFASFTALDLAGRVRAASGLKRSTWIAAAAIAMGGGIWSMHFVAMLAYSMPIAVSFDLVLTLVSLILAVVVAGIGFVIVAPGTVGVGRLLAGGLVMGLGIAGMHYTGMAAMRMPADLHHDGLWVALSILIAIGAAVAALTLAFSALGWIGRLTAAALIGIAVSGMHYTAMTAANFTHSAAAGRTGGYVALNPLNLALGVALVTCFILALALVASTFNQPRREADLSARRSVRRTRSDLALLLGASILVPVGVFTLAAWQNWRSLEAAAEERVTKSVSLIAEHALKVFQNNEQVLNRADEYLRGVPLDQMRSSFPINIYLNTLTEQSEHLNTVGIVGPDGQLLNASRSFPALPFDFKGRDFFDKAEATPVRSYVSEPVEGLRDPSLVFRLSRQRTSPDGRPAGVLFASMAPEYFAGFYRSVTGGEDSVTMARSDGVVLVRDPPVTTGVTVLSANSGLMQSIARSSRGIYRSASELDGVRHLHAYQQVGRYPVYVSYGLSMSAVEEAWHTNLLAFGGVAALASLALSTLSFLALRRASQERSSFRRWQREVELRETAEDALRQSQKMEAVGQLTGGIAHDFNNLLTVVSGNLELAQRALEKGNIARIHRNIEAALSGAHRAAALTQRLLAFSRRQALQPQVSNLNKIVAGMSDLFRRTMGESIHVETVLAGGLWPTFADPNQFESALLNLVINARDAMPNGGRLTIETANSHLDEAYAASNAEVTPGQYVMIAVTDTGTGIAPDVMKRVFEPFFTTKEIGQGTGLGLSMIYGFVKQTGGHVNIYSEVGEGTTVKIYLPRSLQDDTGTAPVKAHAPRAQAGETVLVVEDDPDVRAYSVESLTALGYHVLEAQDGASALAFVTTGAKVDLLFTDVGLPGMNGRRLADEVLRLRPGVPVLFVSGYTRNAIVHNGTLDPGVHLLNKPFTIEQLAAKVREVIETEEVA